MLGESGQVGADESHYSLSFFLSHLCSANSQISFFQKTSFSYVGAKPEREIIAKESKVSLVDHRTGNVERLETNDPLEEVARISSEWKPFKSERLPDAFTGGWVGYTAYDCVRCAHQMTLLRILGALLEGKQKTKGKEKKIFSFVSCRYGVKKKLPFESAPEDDRALPDINLALYKEVLVFDQARKVVHVVRWADPREESYEEAKTRVDHLVESLRPEQSPQLRYGDLDGLWEESGGAAAQLGKRRTREDDFERAVSRAVKEVEEGEIFQVVLSQRFERESRATPFDVYRALRVVNPSPYMLYMQCRGCTFVSSSPEILCRVEQSGLVVNRPLAGTRPRGATKEVDEAQESSLIADEKEQAEHLMLVDLGRNDVGRVCTPGTVRVERLMEVERYSHVMHLSSTVVGQLSGDLSCWDALKASLPAGTISGAPKVRAMQLIDELEPLRRGPYGGGIGAAGFTGGLDMALALRTIVVPTHPSPSSDDAMAAVRLPGRPTGSDGAWCYHLQAGAGIVADSDPASEQVECEKKAMALSRAISLAEVAF